jgi:hypothetical protein
MISLKITALRRVRTIAHEKNPYRELWCDLILNAIGPLGPGFTHIVCIPRKANRRI